MSRQNKFDHSKIVELKLQGKSNYEIEKIIGCGHTLVSRILKEAGLTKGNIPFSDEEVSFIHQNYSKFGATYCAEHTGRTVVSIMGYAQRHNLYYKKRNNKINHTLISDDDLKKPIKELENVGYSEYYIKKERKKRNIILHEEYRLDEVEFIRNNYPKHGYEYCVKKLNISKTRLKNIIRDFNIGKEPRYDLFYVDSPDSYMAYTLGLLTADGYITDYDKIKRRCISLDQNVDDIITVLPVLYKHIKWRMRASFNNGWGNKIMIRLSLGDRHNIFWKKLNDLGFSNKTYVFPDFLSYLSDEVIKYFIRGFLDGDGNVTLSNQYNGGSIAFTGHKECDWTTLIECLFIHDIDIKYYKQRNCSRIVISRKDSLKNFIEDFYQKDGIYFPRKFQKIQHLAQVLECKVP